MLRRRKGDSRPARRTRVPTGHDDKGAVFRCYDSSRFAAFCGLRRLALRECRLQIAHRDDGRVGRAAAASGGASARRRSRRRRGRRARGGLLVVAGRRAHVAAEGAYSDPTGSLGILNTAGDISTKGHPFFEPIGTNGRACVTCHQPADAMSVVGGDDPRALGGDGRQGSAVRRHRRRELPESAAGGPASHSLLLNRGLFRVFLPWPPRTRDGSAIEPEFTIEVVRDPTGCNTRSAVRPRRARRRRSPFIAGRARSRT